MSEQAEPLYRKVMKGKRVTYEPVSSPVLVTSKNEGPLSEDAKTIHISLAVGMLEIVRYDENKFKPKSARTASLNNLIDNSLRVCEFYRVNAWPPHKQEKAMEVLDKAETLVRQHFAGIKFNEEGEML